MTMYPGEGMYVDDPIPHPHHHHLPKMDDDDYDDDDNDHDDCDHPHHNHNHNHNHNHQGGCGGGNSPYPPQHQHRHHNHPPNHPRNTPPPPRHPTPPPSKRSPSLAPLQPQQPLQPPTPLCPPQPLQPPTPLIPQPPLQPPVPLQPPPQSSQPPPEKPRPPPPMDLNHPHHYNDADDDHDEKHKNPAHQQLGAAIFVVLLLFGLAALILWLIYRPSKPQFTAIAALVYSLNFTGAVAGDAPPSVAASMQFVIHTRNPNKRTTLTYDRLAATVYYRNTAITPLVALPPLFHRKKSSVIIAPVVGGPPPAVAVPVGPEVVEGLAADEAYGVVEFSWVVVGRVRYRVGGFKSGHSRVFVRCDVVVRLIGGGRDGGGFSGGVYTNPSGQVPLLGTPPCFVDI